MSNIKKNPVVHFEVPYGDSKRVVEFYSKTFGWDMKVMGPEMGDYILATTAESNEKGPVNTGAINGGFFPLSDDQPAKAPLLTIQVDDIKESMARVKDAGGEVFGEPVDIPGVGLYIAFSDTEGNRGSLMQSHSNNSKD